MNQEEFKKKYRWIMGKTLNQLRNRFNYSEAEIEDLDYRLDSFSQLNSLIKCLKDLEKELNGVQTHEDKLCSPIPKQNTASTITKQLQKSHSGPKDKQASPFFRHIPKKYRHQFKESLVKELVNEAYSDLFQKKCGKPSSEYLQLTPFETPEKMVYNQSSSTSNQVLLRDGDLSYQCKNGSIQIEGDIITQTDEIFNLALSTVKLIDSQKKFAAILMDPPWTGTGCILGYQTIKNKQWMERINLDLLQDNGLVFMWVTNRMDIAAIKYMQSQGYEKIETIPWVKVSKSGRLISRIGRTLRHSHELCLVFRKLQKGVKDTDLFRLRKANNVIISRVLGPVSQKPFQLYDIIEMVCPGGPYLEIFGRAGNQRKGWITIGNESIEYRRKSVK